MVLQQFRQVTLAGFDWWEASERHHYCDAQTFETVPGRGHQPEVEKRFFEKLRDERRLRWWTDSPDF